MPTLSRAERHAYPADCAGCRMSIRQGSRSFYLASLLLPISIREPAYAVYAFCRQADDLIDQHQGGAAALDTLHAMVDRIYAGRPGDDFVERAFTDAVNDHRLPRLLPEALIEGLSWDAAGRRYETFSDLTDYAVRVAATVGAMMTLVMGRREPQVLARACDLGVAMQFTNICRDIGEDARMGRLYLPSDMLRAEGVDPDRWLAAPDYSPGVRAVTNALLRHADRLYDRSVAGIGALPRAARTGIGAARLLYREIGRQIDAGVDPVQTRAITTPGRKLALLGRSFATQITDHGTALDEGLAQAQFLIAAVAEGSNGPTWKPMPQWWDVAGRTAHMLELLHAFSVPEPTGPGAIRRQGA